MTFNVYSNLAQDFVCYTCWPGVLITLDLWILMKVHRIYWSGTIDFLSQFFPYCLLLITLIDRFYLLYTPVLTRPDCIEGLFKIWNIVCRNIEFYSISFFLFICLTHVTHSLINLIRRSGGKMCARSSTLPLLVPIF